METRIITTTEDLAAFCASFGDEQFITVDTEFIRERTYFPQLCLMQVATSKLAVAIDPLIFDRRGTNGLQVQERSVEERAKFHYTLAKTFAKAGILEQALQNVRFALEYGFKEREKFRSEPEFAILQSDADFQKLMATEPRVL